MSKGACEQCGLPNSVRPGRKFCSRSCMATANEGEVALRDCEWCGKQIPRMWQPSRNRLETPSSYSQRRFCSSACAAEPRKGRARKNLLLKHCAWCGEEMIRRVDPITRIIEKTSSYQKRRTCSKACRQDLIEHMREIGEWRDPWLRNPHSLGRRRLIARTCAMCDALKSAAAFDQNGNGYWNSTCRDCTAARNAETTRDWLNRQQRETRAAAHKFGQEWTGAELEIACREDLSVKEIAKMLGRTYSAVSRARSLARGASPMKHRVAGVA